MVLSVPFDTLFRVVNHGSVRILGSRSIVPLISQPFVIIVIVVITPDANQLLSGI